MTSTHGPFCRSWAGPEASPGNGPLYYTLASVRRGLAGNILFWWGGEWHPGTAFHLLQALSGPGAAPGEAGRAAVSLGALSPGLPSLLGVHMPLGRRMCVNKTGSDGGSEGGGGGSWANRRPSKEVPEWRERLEKCLGSGPQKNAHRPPEP